jgi:ATP/maltotriose-dependent transcriptional regulator MalT
MDRVLTAIEERRGWEPALMEAVKVSDREREVILLVVEGLSNKEIARRLRIAEGTVKLHLHNVYGKLGVSNRTALVASIDRQIRNKNSKQLQWRKQQQSRPPIRLVG